MKDQFGKAFCVLPWTHSFVNLGGEYQVCCTSEEYHRGIRDSNGNIFTIKDKPSLDEIMNSDFMKKIRLQMLDGEFPRICSRCVVSENNDGISRRNVENSKLQQFVPVLIENTQIDGSIPLDIKSADYRLGNLCNLQCRMCNPRSTKTWINDWNKVKAEPEQLAPKDVAHYSSYDWINDEYTVQEMESKLQGLEQIHFAGGEPLIAPRMTELLQKCIDSGYAKNILLTYNTNITQLPKSVLALWKEFKTVRLFCSIDGFGKVNEYIRFPSKWSVIDKNLRYLDENAQELNISQILLSTTVQAHNVLNLDQLYGYLKQFKNIVPAMNLINLYSPLYLSTQLLPTAVKKLAAERLLAFKPELYKIIPPNDHYLVENIDDIINFMMGNNYHERYWKAFTDYNGKVDELKSLSFQECIPELYDLLPK